MALQPSAPLNHAQANALYAIVNMQQAADAAELRVQDATDETFRSMQEALNQSESNNRSLMERIAQLTSENNVLKQQIKDVSSNADAQKGVQEKVNEAERERVRALVTSANAGLSEITEYASKAKVGYAALIPQYNSSFLDAYELEYLVGLAKRQMGEMNQLLEQGRKIQSQISQINQ